MRVARVVPDVAGIEAEFDYLIPEKFDASIRVGTIVRVVLNGRRVRGWVIDDNATPPEGVRLLEIQKVTGSGPSEELIDLAAWAAWRWAGKRSFFLQTASPLRSVPPRSVPSVDRSTTTTEADRSTLETQLLRRGPAAGTLDLVLDADNAGPSLVIVPQQRVAERLVEKLRKEGRRVALYPDDWAQAAGGGVTVVGTRAAAWAPMPQLTSILVLDAHDESLQSERSPTWSAVEVAAERARRRHVQCALVSAVPRLEQQANGVAAQSDRSEERRAWAPLHVVDLRHTDPRTGLYSPALVELLRSEKRVVCVINRKGRAQLLVCSACDEIARCERCQGALSLADEVLQCVHCHERQPVVCRYCTSTKFKQLRPGVNRIREDLESLALREVGEVTGDSEEIPGADILVGTEAVLHRIGRADAIVFLDFDQELLASRYRATEDALILLARGSRIVGGRDRGGIVMVQTRQPEHEVIDAALHGDPDRFFEKEAPRREDMHWPPSVAMARISGQAAAAYVAKLEGLDVLGPLDGTWLVQARNHTALCDALAAVPRPNAVTLRVEVDPPRA